MQEDTLHETKKQRKVDDDPVNGRSRCGMNKTEAVLLGHHKVLGETFVNMVSAPRALARWPLLRHALPGLCGFSMLLPQWHALAGTRSLERTLLLSRPSEET